MPPPWKRFSKLAEPRKAQAMGLSEGWAGVAQATGLAILAAAVVAGGAYAIQGPQAFKWQSPNTAGSDSQCISSADSEMVIGQARQVGLVMDTKLDGYSLILVVDRRRFEAADYATIRGVALAYFCGMANNDVGVRSVDFRTSPSGATISRFSSSDLRAAIG